MATKTQRRKAAENRIKAMSHPLRAEVLRFLSERTASPAEMARELDEELSNVSYHTKQLVEFECAELVSTRPVRGALEHFYRATERHLIDVGEWEELDPLMAENLLCEIVQKTLDDFVAAARAQTIGSDDNFHLTRTRLVLDAEGLREALEAHERARLEILDIEARSAQRLLDAGEQGMPVSTSQGCFKMPEKRRNGS
ncbi:MAG TPA: helix-turn-helix domain-containing protein [Solirubrobacterales bacterium]|nr:helix-turn-helix domain-containing protein [Solirubrobacterales bacterium]